MAEYVPHALVFPRAAAIVHRAASAPPRRRCSPARPMLVVPFGFDQPDNAARAVRLGVALTLPRRGYDAGARRARCARCSRTRRTPRGRARWRGGSPPKMARRTPATPSSGCWPAARSGAAAPPEPVGRQDGSGGTGYVGSGAPRSCPTKLRTAMKCLVASTEGRSALASQLSMPPNAVRCSRRVPRARARAAPGRRRCRCACRRRRCTARRAAPHCPAWSAPRRAASRRRGARRTRRRARSSRASAPAGPGCAPGRGRSPPRRAARAPCRR